MVKSEQAKIAEAALRAVPATHMLDLEADIMAESGCGALAVRTLLTFLVREGVLNACVRSARTRAGETADNAPPLMWYEKGARWDEFIKDGH